MRALLIICISILPACRKDTMPIVVQQEMVSAADPGAVVKGMYVLNEGNINSNKASLDYMDFTTGMYIRNIYEQANPEITKGLGDVGNAIGIYGSKLYLVINNSNKVEVLDVHTCRRINQIDIINGRYIYFYNGHAYVSAYLGKVGDPNASNGIVAEIDTATLTVTRRVNVGRQPEEMAVVANKLYVANSGGYSPPDYEHTISVIDIAAFTEVKRIDVAINLNRLKADQSGNIYVTSRGDYFGILSGLYKVSTQSDEVVKNLGIPANDLWIDDNRLFAYSAGWNYNTGKNVISYNVLDISSESPAGESFIKDGTDQNIGTPRGIAINPVTKDIFVCDAKDFVTPGTLFCFDKTGVKKWSVTTGDMPGQFAFVY